jgi:hypothetical protein
MSLNPNRRAAWIPGALLIVSAAAVSLLAGIALGLRSWPGYLALGVAALLLVGWLERLRARRPAAPRSSPRARSRLKVIRGGKGGYDLANDDSTDDQRYLM